MKLTLAAYAIGLAGIVYASRKQAFGTTYKRVWGLSLLVVGASILADVAPKAVGPYMGLVALVFLVSPSTGLGKLFGAAEQAGSGGAGGGSTFAPGTPGVGGNPGQPPA